MKEVIKRQRSEAGETGVSLVGWVVLYSIFGWYLWPIGWCRDSWPERGRGKVVTVEIKRQRSEAVFPDVDGKRAKPRHVEEVMHFVQYGCKLFTFLRYFLAYFNTRLFKPNPSCYSN